MMQTIRSASAVQHQGSNGIRSSKMKMRWDALPAWVFLLSLAGYPLVASLSAITGLSNRPLSIGFRAAIVSLSIVTIWRILALAKNRWDGTFWFFWWLFWGTYLLRMAFDLVVVDSARNFPPFEYASFAIGGCLIPAIAMAYPVPDRVHQRTVRYLVWLALAGLLGNGWVMIFNGGLLDVLRVEALRAESDFLNPIALGHLAVTLFIVSLWRLAFVPGHSVPERVFLVVCLVVGVTALIASGSRGPTLSLAVCLFMLVVMEKRRFRSAPLLAAVLVIAVLIYLVSDELISSFWFDRLSGGAFQDATRTQLMRAAWDSFTDSPLLGAGIDPHYAYPHNLPIEAFMAGGLVTGLAFLALVVYASVAALRAWKCVRADAWVFLLFFQYAVGAMVSGAIYMSTTFWVLMVAVISLWEWSRRDGVVRLVAVLRESRDIR